ncbi:HAD family hydrolase [Mycetocola lacteus]|uniref:HAD family hydrolase n=1 Tax=Mycetocola lacteus TaxID=76637 RepID=A0A3L7AEX5_9MICO|nr:HAD hydrolase-like protein [Mycetocola lacteus]RLP78807.1 HAD family hydrolase [Mycetocola lacteus]
MSIPTIPTTVPATSERPTTQAWTCVLLDLDGTLIDSAPGIIERLGRTLASLGLPAQHESEMMRWVGPPLLDSFRDFAGLNEADSWAALERYRSLAGQEDASQLTSVYPGIPEFLKRLNEAGIPLALATSKPESQAERILDHFGLRDTLTVLCGASEDETRSAKADVVAEALVRLRAQGVDTTAPIMVGDRHHDIDGARANGIPTYLVSWGYAVPGEEEGALEVFDSAEVLADRLIAEYAGTDTKTTL